MDENNEERCIGIKVRWYQFSFEFECCVNESRSMNRQLGHGEPIIS